MKTLLTPKNPFSYDRYSFAFENINENDKCLDYGCFDGNFIRQVVEAKKNINFVGVDKNKDIVESNPFSLDLVLLEEKLEFVSEFDFVSILDVIEHIHRQDDVLKQLNKSLKMGGRLVITAPKKGLFSFLDLGNLKFIFPKLHKFFYILKHSREEYGYRYLNNPSGLIGDIEKEKSWHQHFTESEMKTLVERNGFRVESFDGSGLFLRVFSLFNIFKLGFLVPTQLKILDAKCFESSNLFCLAIKIKEVSL